MVLERIAPEVTSGPDAEWKVTAWQHPILAQLAMPDSTDMVFLINPDLAPLDQPFRNLVRVDAPGNLVWKAELPDPQAAQDGDSYVAVEWVDGRLAANTWSGYYTLIDAATGQIVSVEFVR